MNYSILRAAVAVLGFISIWPAQAEGILPMGNTAAIMPAHGTVSIAPAARWEESLASGNGIHGALLAGDPQHETLIANHCKLWLPLGSREVVPDVGAFLPELRRVIGQKDYDAGQKYFENKAKEQGWDGKLIWTDKFHPGFFLKLDQSCGAISDYARVEDFATGDVRVQWRTDEGEFSRRMFVSRTENVIVLKLSAPAGKLSVKLRMDKIDNPLIESAIVHNAELITAHSVYVKGKGGYDSAVRVTATGGAVNCDGKSIQITDGDSAVVIARIQPWKTPLPGSEAWPFRSANPDFLNGNQSAPHTQRAAPAYKPEWMKLLKNELAALPDDYNRLLKPHAAVHRALFDRVAIDLGGAPVERGMSSEALLDLAGKEKRLPAALLERMYDAGRYEFICSAGPDTPPNLFGIWTGTWEPAWSGDYTLDTNLQLDIESALSGNLAECMGGYFNLMENFVPDFRTNAIKLYGCRGILAGSRASNTGIHMHWGNGWPGNMWTPGAPWLAHWFFDYYAYTGDRKFLKERAVPFMKECALFYEDFLRGTEDARGCYTFRPSFSAENGWADNASQDLSICRELLTNLIRACEILRIEQDGIQKWKGMLAKLPPYLINDEGQLKEWATPGKGENNNHRHLMHLYGAFEWPEFNESSDPKLLAAAKVALLNRINSCRERSTHGRMHMALAATQLGMGNEAFGRLELMATLRSMYSSMLTSHEPGPDILCDDGNGTIPEVVNRMIVQSSLDKLILLPAVPDALPQGELRGIRARGQIGIDRIVWNMKAGTLAVQLTSNIKQQIMLAMPRGTVIDAITCGGEPQRVQVSGCMVTLPKRKAIEINIRFHSDKATTAKH